MDIADKPSSSTIDPSQVLGWGVDADPENDPTYPMKSRNDGEHAGYSWERPPQQAVEVEVLHSNERPNVSAVFGTSTPPSGLSGVIRRHAFQYSESSYGHWVPLLLADRINVVEGVLDDLTHAKIPNLWSEYGWNAEWMHNRKNFVARMLVAASIAAIVGGMLVGRRERATASQRQRRDLAQRRLRG
jgi:hypothetical protein